MLSFIGDIMAHRINYVLPDYTEIYVSVEDYLSADFLSFGNFEFPVDSSREYSSYPRFNATKEYVEAALLAGVDVLSLGNNHAFDQGREGIFQTMRSLRELEEKLGRRLYTSGIRGNLSAPFAPTLIIKGGLRIGFLAVTQMVNQYQRFEYVQIVDYQNGRHLRQFLPYIRRAAGDYDLFILSYHGGREYARNADPEKLRFFRQLIEAGVDIVYAHHPHVLQPYYLHPHQNGLGLIPASTGNFVSGMTWGIDPSQPENARADTGDSALFQVELTVAGGVVRVERVQPFLISNWINERGGMVVETFERLLGRELPGNWGSYYRRRFEITSKIFKGN